VHGRHKQAPLNDPDLCSAFLFASATPERPFPREAINQFKASVLACSREVSRFIVEKKKNKRTIRALFNAINRDMMKHTLYDRNGVPWGVNAMLVLRYPSELKIAVLGDMSLFCRDLMGWFDCLEDGRDEDEIHSLDCLGSYKHIDVEYHCLESGASEGDFIVANSDGASALLEANLTTYYDKAESALKALPLLHRDFVNQFPTSYLVSIPQKLHKGFQQLKR
jgi:hypothetical protein